VDTEITWNIRLLLGPFRGKLMVFCRSTFLGGFLKVAAFDWGGAVVL